MHPESVLGMPSRAQLHYKKDQIESNSMGWTRNFFIKKVDWNHRWNKPT